MVLEGKNVVVGVCGGIAAYKVVEVVSRLKKMKANVHVIMTEHATEFVAPLTFQSISHNPVTVGMFEKPNIWDIQHISLAQSADIFIIAPATANFIGKLANGICDDMLTSTVLATTAKVVIAPAMNYNMYANPLVQENIAKLIKLGYYFMEPGTGPMAEGSSGKGRLPEPEEIVNEVIAIYSGDSIGESCVNNDINQDLMGLKILITAGPTKEPIDPVRFISNHSSGKMGYSISKKAVLRGAEVILISGSVSIPAPNGVNLVLVETALDMLNEVNKYKNECNVLIFSAAVADYRCASIEQHKIKKEKDELTIELIKNPDIAYEVGKEKGDRKHIGFAAETQELEINALKKLHKKNLDYIVANDITLEGAGFGVDTNIVKIYGKEGIISNLPKLSKDEVADKILDLIVIKN